MEHLFKLLKNKDFEKMNALITELTGQVPKTIITEDTFYAMDTIVFVESESDLPETVKWELMKEVPAGTIEEPITIYVYKRIA